MRWLWAVPLAAGLLLWSPPALAFYSVAFIGTHNQAASITNQLTFTGSTTCPAGSTIVLSASYLTLADPLTSVADSAGNTYQTPIDAVSGTGVGIGTAYAFNTAADLPITTGTITATMGGAVTSTVGAVCIRGASAPDPLDTHNNSAVGVAAMASTTVNSGALALPRGVAIGVLGTSTSMGGGPPCNGSYTRSVSSPTTVPGLIVCTQLVSSTASLAFAPTWSLSTNYAVDLLTFKGVPATLATTGVGY